MRVVVVGPVYPVKGGISYYTTEMSRRLATKHEVIVFTFERIYTSFLYSLFYAGNSGLDTYSQITKANVNLRKTISGNPFSWLFAAWQIRKLLPDVILVPWVEAYMFPLIWLLQTLKPKGAKLIFICHNVSGHEKRLFAKDIARCVFRRADGVITHSAGETKELLRLCPLVKHAQAYLPTYTLQKKSASVEKMFKLRDKVLIFFGYVRPFKGLRYLLKAMPLVLKKIDVDLLIVGEFWEDKQDYLNLINELGIQSNVKIIDHYVPNEDVGKYFACADVAVLPYVDTTQSAVVQVAYAHNTPVIATNVGGLVNDVIHGKTGFLVKPKDEKSLADAIIKFYQRKHNSFVKNVKKIKQKFSWEEYISRLERLF